MKLALVLAASLVATLFFVTPPADAAEAFDQLVDIGGRRLALTCAGSGRTTVILENGLPPGAPLHAQEAWAAVMPAVASFTRVCTYDRANLGQSDPAPGPRTSQAIVDDLRALLGRAGISGPRVLVGWWVDLPESFRQLASAGPLPAVPLVVLRRGQRGFPEGDAEFPDLEPVWHELQADLARRSPRGVLLVAEQSGHEIQRDEPERVAEAIRQVLGQLRTPIQVPVQVPR